MGDIKKYWESDHGVTDGKITISEPEAMRMYRREPDELEVGDVFENGGRLYVVTGFKTMPSYGKGETLFAVLSCSYNVDGSDMMYEHKETVCNLCHGGLYTYIPNAEEFERMAESVENGDIVSVMPERDIEVETESLAKVSAEGITDTAQELMLYQAKYIRISKMMKVRVERMKDMLSMRAKEIEKLVSGVRKQMDNVFTVLTMLNMYLGKEINVKVLSKGTAADSGEPLTLRQRVLYMDEEVAVTKDGGLDFDDVENGVFDKWLLEGDNLSTILPEQKCIVAMKPRRKPTRRYADPVYEREMEHWNKYTFFIIRNGENVYRVDSENMSCDKVMFPLKNEMQDILDKASSSNSTFSRKDYEELFERKSKKYYTLALMIQGFIDNTDMFSFEGERPSVFNPECYGKSLDMVYDAENLLSSGHMSFVEWVERHKNNTHEGNRILFHSRMLRLYGYGDRGRREWARDHMTRYYENTWSIPVEPEDGVYTIHENVPSADTMSFTYLPKQDVFDRETYTYNQRKAKVRYIIRYDDMFLNYDMLTVDDIDYYLKSREDREHYLDMMPLLISAKRELEAEMESERKFADMTAASIANETGADFEQVLGIVSDAIVWWKTKVICKRPVKSDDAKAWRMITKKVKKEITDNNRQ